MFNKDRTTDTKTLLAFKRGTVSNGNNTGLTIDNAVDVDGTGHSILFVVAAEAGASAGNFKIQAQGSYDGTTWVDVDKVFGEFDPAIDNYGDYLNVDTTRAGTNAVAFGDVGADGIAVHVGYVGKYPKVRINLVGASSYDGNVTAVAVVQDLLRK